MADPTLRRAGSAGDGETASDVIFLHGLGGDADGTWRNDQNAWWPDWVAADVDDAAIASIGYDAAPIGWLGGAMPIADRAANLLALLEAEGYGSRPIVFVGHSLGGLVVKQMLHTAQGAGNEAWKQIADGTAGLVFLATPHAGSKLADYLGILSKLLRTTDAVGDLEAHSAPLRDLNTWFRNYVSQRALPVRVFFETKATAKAVHVVDATSADPGLVGAPPVPIDADHWSISKPASRDALVHKSLCRFIRDLTESPPEAEIDPADRPPPTPEPAPIEDRPRRYFISYRRRAETDAVLARYLKGELEKAGAEVFMDIDMAVGADWSAEITRRLDWCDYLVPLLSESSVHSEMVQGEIRMAHDRRQLTGRPQILPIRVAFDGKLDYELACYLDRVQYKAWRTPDDNWPVLQALLDAFDSVLPGNVWLSKAINILTPARPARPTAPDVTPSDTEPVRPVPQVDVSTLVRPTGTIAPGDPLYIRRGEDAEVDRLAAQSGVTLLIKAPRQMGKSSLLQRYIAASKAHNKQMVTIDCQQLDATVLPDLPTLLNYLAKLFRRRLKLPRDPEAEFDAPLDFTDYMADEILPALDRPLVIAFDELDRFLDLPFGASFFAMLRGWHNARAGSEAWRQVDLALVVATEPYLFIPDADQSPFNVGDVVVPRVFDQDCCSALNHLHRTPLTAIELSDLHELTGGQPYLTRVAFYWMVAGDRMSFTDLLEQAHDGDGPFGDHLKHLLVKLRDADLVEAMQQVVHQHSIPGNDEMIYHRLRGAGLVARSNGKVDPANRLYARFFEGAL